MVGVPRSKGCLLCVQRRIKCDQAKPHCGNCTRYGTCCPGYDRSFKFVSGKHRIKPRGDGPAKTHAGDRARASPGPESGVVAARRSPPPELDDTLVLGLPAPRGPYIGTMLSHMYSSLAPSEEWFLGSWFTGVEPRLGSQAALDGAAMSLILHVLGKANRDDRLIGESRSIYGRSLQALQIALNHRSEWRTTETLCAATILCYYELFAGTKDAASWMAHARGVGWLIRQRGPHAILTEWDKAIFRNFRILISLDALFSGEDCFLAQPQWQAALRRLAFVDEDPNSYEGRRRAVTDKYCMILAKVPTIFRHIIHLHSARKVGGPVALDRRALAPLMRYAEKILHDLDVWSRDLHDMFTPPTEVPSRDPSSPFPLVYRFENVWEGSLYVGYWATRILLQYSLVVGSDRDDLHKENRTLCNNIYKSLETVGAGLMGPYRVGYGLRIAYEPAEPHIRRWIKSLLTRYGEIYAGLEERSFSDPADREWAEIVDESVPPGLR